MHKKDLQLFKTNTHDAATVHLNMSLERIKNNSGFELEITTAIFTIYAYILCSRLLALNCRHHWIANLGL